jgi:hypothetical protein
VTNTYAKVVALLGFAALGTWIALRRTHRSASACRTVQSAVEIDDDTAADIIRRALPALERARELAIAR